MNQKVALGQLERLGLKVKQGLLEKQVQPVKQGPQGKLGRLVKLDHRERRDL